MTRRRVLAGLGLAVLVILVLAVRLVRESSSPEHVTGLSDAPFGPFVGYAWRRHVHSVEASFTVPRIASGSALGEAATWIGVQG